MNKKAYIQPVSKVLGIENDEALLDVSYTKVSTNGFDDDDLNYDDDNKSGSLWDDAR